ncbi:MAG: YdeI/OmpD-associated family protein [Ferruginibacter sp.]
MAKFQTSILTAGKTATGICIPDDIIEKLGAGKKPRIKVTLNGYTYRSTVAVMGGKYMVGVNAAVREASGVKGGDKLTVEIELDTEERKVSVPPGLKKALDKNPKAKKFFETLSYSKQKVHTDLIAQAKTEETLQRRIEKSISELNAGKK